MDRLDAQYRPSSRHLLISESLHNKTSSLGSRRMSFGWSPLYLPVDDPSSQRSSLGYPLRLRAMVVVSGCVKVVVY